MEYALRLGTTVAGELTRLRTRRGLTVCALARRTGVPRESIYRMERGEHLPTLFLAARLCHGLGLPLWEVVAAAEAPPCPVSST